MKFHCLPRKMSVHATALLMAFALTMISAVSLSAQNGAATVPPPATPQGMYVTSVTAGYIDPAGKVPTVSGVPGSAVTNMDVSFPVSLLVHGNQYVYSISLQNNNFTGSATVSFRLAQVQGGKPVTLDSGTITKFNTVPGDVWLWVTTGKVIPNSPGSATLTGIVSYNGTKTVMSVPVLLQ